MELFHLNNIFFTILGYQMSYIEFIGTLLNLWSVWLVTRNNIWTWPIGNIGVVLFAIIFYQIHLYSDLTLQIYFLITGFYGWWVWAFQDRKGEKHSLTITQNTLSNNVVILLQTAIASVALGFCMVHIHQWLPSLFPKPASFPYLDASVAVMSCVANLLMAHKKIECWYLWIAVDILSIGLYFTKGVNLIGCLYIIFLGLAIKGLLNWRKIRKIQRV